MKRATSYRFLQIEKFRGHKLQLSFESCFLRQQSGLVLGGLSEACIDVAQILQRLFSLLPALATKVVVVIIIIAW